MKFFSQSLSRESRGGGGDACVCVCVYWVGLRIEDWMVLYGGGGGVSLGG